MAVIYFLHKMPGLQQPWPDAIDKSFTHQCSPRPSYKAEKWFLCGCQQKTKPAAINMINTLPYTTHIIGTIGSLPDSEIETLAPWLRRHRQLQAAKRLPAAVATRISDKAKPLAEVLIL